MGVGMKAVGKLMVFILSRSTADYLFEGGTVFSALSDRFERRT
jgi:hypothetical protein